MFLVRCGALVVRAAGDLVTLCRGSMGETAMPRWKGVRLARGG